MQKQNGPISFAHFNPSANGAWLRDTHTQYANWLHLNQYSAKEIKYLLFLKK